MQRKGNVRMERYWTWSGSYVGVRQRDYLVAWDGRVLGRFYGKEIYDRNGDYRGELGRNGRLLKNCAKEGFRRPSFSDGVKGTISTPLRDCAPYPLLAGFEDFS